MANNKSAKKRVLQTAVKTERNRYYRTRIKNIIKAVHEAVEAADKTAAAEAFKVANKLFWTTPGILKRCISSPLLFMTGGYRNF